MNFDRYDPSQAEYVAIRKFQIVFPAGGEDVEVETSSGSEESAKD